MKFHTNFFRTRSTKDFLCLFIGFESLTLRKEKTRINAENSVSMRVLIVYSSFEYVIVLSLLGLKFHIFKHDSI